MFDSQYEINTIVKKEFHRINDINYSRKKAASFQSKQLKEEVVSQDFIDEMTRFQSLLNMLYERSIRQCYESSIESYISLLDNILNNVGESLSKDIREKDVEEGDIMSLAKDPVLAKRMT